MEIVTCHRIQSLSYYYLRAHVRLLSPLVTALNDAWPMQAIIAPAHA